MYPSFTSTTLDPRTYSSLYNHNNNTNLSKTHREDYCPPSSSSFQLPSPQYINLDDGMIFNELLLQESLFSDDHSNHNANDIALHQEFASNDVIRVSLQPAMVECNNNNGDDGFKKPKNSSKRRRSSKNDRHSKINTARGPRDRRMRLSLDVGKKFFKLQDMLGFDKPSKTVEWLLMKSKSNIQELISHGKPSFLSTIFSESSTSNLSEFIDGDHNAKSSSSSTQKAKKKMSRGVRKSAYLLRPLAKKTREMARKRARERTLEKSGKLACASGGDDQFVACVNGGDDQFAKIRPCFDQKMDRNMNFLGPWVINQPEQSSSSSVIGSWNPSVLFNYQQTEVHPQEHQLNDFQILGNLWEVKN